MRNALQALSIISAASACVVGLVGCSSDGPAKASDVKGRYILALSDADMTSTALFDGFLGDIDPAARDVLTVLKLPLGEVDADYAQLPVSSSAVGPSKCLDVTADGTFAFVVETRKGAPPGALRLEELPIGDSLFAIDLTDPMAPVLRSQSYVGVEPMAVAVHPEGDLVAVVTRTEGAQLVAIPFVDGKLADEPFAWPLLGVEDSGASPSCVSWHPSGRALAVTLPEQDRVVFYRFVRGQAEDEGGVSSTMAIVPWGEPVAVGKYPLSGVFTPDGRHYITTDLQWGRDVDGFAMGAPAGQLSCIRLGDLPRTDDPDELQDADAGHSVVSTAPVGISPKGIAMSSDGKLIVTANLRRSFLPDEDPRQTRGGSLSLVSINGKTGELTAVEEYDLAAMPEGLSFDASGRFVLVTQFRSFDPDAMDGELSIWRVRGDVPSLEHTNLYVGVGKGPHGVLIVR